MPSLYGTSTSYTVTASNVIGLYQVSTSSAVITATTYSTNLVGLYGGYWSPDPITQFVNTIVAGPGISVNTSSGNVTVSNTGVLSLTAGTNTNISSTTGNITVWTNPVAIGVTAITAGSGISVSTSTGSVVVTNTGVLSLIAGTNTNVSSTTGNITVWTNTATPFDISTWTNQRLFTTSSVQFNQLSVTGSNISSSTAAVSINLSSNTSITPQTNSNIWAVNRPGSVARFLFDTYIDPSPVDGQDKSYISGRRARGTASAPTALQTNDPILNLNGYGYGTTKFGNASSAGITFYAAENLTDTALGGKILYYVMPIGGSTITDQITVATMDQYGILISNAKNLRLLGGGAIQLNTTGSNITFPNGTVQTTAFTGTIAVNSLTAGVGISVSTSTGSVVVTNTGVLSLIAGTNTNISSTTGNITIWTSGGGSSNGVSSITASTGIGVSTSTGSVVITNLGVTNLTGTSALGVSNSTGSITLTNLGVTALAGGTAITVSNSTGSVTINNAGVTGLVAGTNTNISSTTGNITIWTTPVATGVTAITAGSGISVSTSTGSVVVTNTGVLSLIAGTNTNISSTTGNITIWNSAATPFDISTWTNQRLFTTSSVVFGSVNVTTGTQVAQTISAGGYPLDGNGQALTLILGTQSPALFVSNYVSGQRGNIQLRSYSQNTTGGTTATSQPAQIQLEHSRGNPAGLLPTLSGNTIGQLNFGGYDGVGFVGSSPGTSPSGAFPAYIAYVAAENFANNGTTTTNAGVRFTTASQPLGVQFDATSRQTWLDQTWAAGSTATNSPPIMSIALGTTANAILTPSGGVGSFNTGYGRTNLLPVNVNFTMNGVTVNDSAPDNPTLTDTNHIIITGSRGSGLGGRRQPLLINDEMASIRFTAQNVANGTGNGITASTINALMLENATTTTSGASLILKTVNSGTTSLNIRLYMTDRLMSYQSDNHTFTNAAGSSPRMILTSSSNVLNSNIHNFFNQASTAGLLSMTAGSSGSTNTYSNDTHTFRNQAGTVTVLSITSGTSNYNNDLQNFNNSAGSSPRLTLGANLNTYNNDTHNFNNSANTKLLVNITTASGVNFRGYTETLFSAAYTATFAPDVSTATIWAMILGGNVTFNGFTNPQAGQSASIYFVQDSTGTRTLSSTMKFANGSKTLTTTPGATDMIAVTYGGAIGYYASLVKGFV
jgi:hypothetical protein